MIFFPIFKFFRKTLRRKDNWHFVEYTSFIKANKFYLPFFGQKMVDEYLFQNSHLKNLGNKILRFFSIKEEDDR